MAKVDFEIFDNIKQYGETVGFGWSFECYGGEDPEEDDVPLSIIYAITMQYMIKNGIADEFIEAAMNDYIASEKDEEVEEPPVDTTKTANIIKMLKKNTGIDE